MIYGARIKQARHLLGESQTLFAERVGLRQPQVSAAETDALQLGDKAVLAIAEHTGFPPSFFESPAPAPIDTRQFRARVRFKASGRNRVVTAADLVHEAFDMMSTHVSSPPVRIGTVDGTPERAAAEVRSILGLHPHDPIANLTLPLERVGVVVLALPITGNKHDAFSWWDNRGRKRYPVIVTLAGAPGDRLRWNLAHELGHIVLHDSTSSSDVESEADRFAAALLTPLDALRREMPPHPKLSSLYALKARWGVSVQSLIRRGRELGAVGEDQYMSLFRQVSARGERMNERYAIPREKPRAFRKMAEVLFGPIPAPGLAELVQWTPEYANDVLLQFAASNELPRRSARVVPKPSGLADVVPLHRRRT